MKEATGELNMTLVVVIIVGVLSVFFFTVIWPSIEGGLIASSKCADAVCDKRTLQDGMVTCKYYKDGKQKGNDFKCVWKG